MKLFNIQNRDGKIFLGLTKFENNAAVLGDLGMISRLAKQQLETLS